MYVSGSAFWQWTFNISLFLDTPGKYTYHIAVVVRSGASEFPLWSTYIICYINRLYVEFQSSSYIIHSIVYIDISQFLYYPLYHRAPSTAFDITCGDRHNDNRNLRWGKLNKLVTAMILQILQCRPVNSYFTRGTIQFTMHIVILAVNNAIDKLSAPYGKTYLLRLYFLNFTFSSVIFCHNRIVKLTLFGVAYKFIEWGSTFVNGDNNIPASQYENVNIYPALTRHVVS